MGVLIPEVRLQDKVRISAGPHAGRRGIVEKATKQTLQVRLRDSQRSITVNRADIANYSAAARKAWKTMPARSVGRPRGRTSNRRSITLRLDESIWGRFVALEDRGLIADRSAMIEEALDAKLEQLEAVRSDKKAHA